MRAAPRRSSAIPLVAPVLDLLLGTAFGGPAAARECVDYRDTTHWTSRMTRVNGNRPSDVVARYPYAYASYSALGGGVPELAVIDVSDPEQPQIVGSVPIGRLGAVALRWPYVLVTDPDLWIVDVSDPTAPAVVSRTGLPGTFARSVWTAARAGRQEIRWDGRGPDGAPAAAGVYFFVVRGGDGATARGKITLVR